ncbi:MAG: M50 family metallopeptidase, partial [Candidatus Methanoperedens sp.]|nr:M50 family metallopeptidase [Candidatus Methanoperedens sp.]
MNITDFTSTDWIIRSVSGYIIVLLVQVIILFFLSNFLMKRTARCTIGWSMYLFYAFVFVGTVIHEASHAIAVVLSGGKLREVHLFKPDRQNGTLGYVRYNANNVSSVFIGFAPLVGNTLALMFFARYFLGVGAFDVDFNSLSNSGYVVSDISRIFTNGLFMLSGLDYSKTGTWLFLYLALSTGMGAAPSPQDVKTALPGIAILGIFWGLVMYVDSA